MSESDDAGHALESLPIDSDVEVGDTQSGRPRPLHLRGRYLLLVGAGGTLGTAAREALTLAFPPRGGVPVTTVAINLVGALLLGLLMEVLARRGDDTGRRRTIRLLVGTGMLGGFTTYSALATDTVLMLRHSAVAGLAYAGTTVIVGAGATLLGVLCGAWWHRQRNYRS